MVVQSHYRFREGLITRFVLVSVEAVEARTGPPGRGPTAPPSPRPTEGGPDPGPGPANGRARGRSHHRSRAVWTYRGRDRRRSLEAEGTSEWHLRLIAQQGGAVGSGQSWMVWTPNRRRQSPAPPAPRSLARVAPFLKSDRLSASHEFCAEPSSNQDERNDKAHRNPSSLFSAPQIRSTGW
jgi:hypothetical protein